MSGFRSFATLLKPPPPPPAAVPPPPAAPVPPPRPAAPVPDPQVTQVIRAFAGELRRLRARAIEVFESEAETALAALAGEVLGRELALAPADIAALVARAKSRIGSESLRIRVAPTDFEAIGEPGAECDPALETGDVVFETDAGTIDMRLGSRVRAVLGGRGVSL